MDFNEILDQFEDYEEDNSILSHETENDVFFYPNNNSILSESCKNQEFENPKSKVPITNTLRSPSPLLKNPFEDHFLVNASKSNEGFINNRKALIKKENMESISNEFQKHERLPSFSSFRENSNSKLSSGQNFYDQEKMESIFPIEPQKVLFFFLFEFNSLIHYYFISYI